MKFKELVKVWVLTGQEFRRLNSSSTIAFADHIPQTAYGKYVSMI